MLATSTVFFKSEKMWQVFSHPQKPIVAIRPWANKKVFSETP